MHRESLEMRLCTEQLWADLSGRASEPQSTQRLARLRRGLADHFQLASQSLGHAKKTNCNNSCPAWHASRRKSRSERTELQRWAAQRQTALEEEAARLLRANTHWIDRMRKSAVCAKNGKRNAANIKRKSGALMS